MQAFADESFHETDAGGFYLLAAAVFDSDDHDLNREAMLRLRAKQGGQRVKKLHWSEMDERRRRDAVTRVADLAGFHVVVVGAPVPRRRQERARAMCLTRLVHELHGYEVAMLFMEARGAVLDRRDIRTVTGARFRLPKGTRFRVEHRSGAAEPLFWVADIVAGAVRAHRGASRAIGGSSRSASMRSTSPRGAERRTCVRPGSRSTPGAPGLATRAAPAVLRSDPRVPHLGVA